MVKFYILSQTTERLLSYHDCMLVRGGNQRLRAKSVLLLPPKNIGRCVSKIFGLARREVVSILPLPLPLPLLLSLLAVFIS
jgi:hypothetical protein